MIIDTLDNLEIYVSLNPLFAEAAKFVKTHDLNLLEPGKIELKGKDLIVNITKITPKTNGEAKLETHNEYIDIQIP
ncbi:Toxin-antitoxin biofilm protein TabA, partial [termite gut metagenome]